MGIYKSLLREMNLPVPRTESEAIRAYANLPSLCYQHRTLEACKKLLASPKLRRKSMVRDFMGNLVHGEGRDPIIAILADVVREVYEERRTRGVEVRS